MRKGKGARLEVVTGTQASFLVRQELARHFGMDLKAVHLVAVDPGGGV